MALTLAHFLFFKSDLECDEIFVNFRFDDDGKKAVFNSNSHASDADHESSDAETSSTGEHSKAKQVAKRLIKKSSIKTSSKSSSKASAAFSFKRHFHKLASENSPKSSPVKKKRKNDEESDSSVLR